MRRDELERGEPINGYEGRREKRGRSEETRERCGPGV